MVEVILFKPQHLTSLRLKLSQKEDKPVSINTYAVTFMRDGQPLAIFGAFWPIVGVVHIWGLVSEDVHQVPHQFFRAVKRYLNHIEKKEGYRRIQIDIREDYVVGHKWAHALGFQLEARLNRYNPDGSNAMLYSRIP